MIIKSISKITVTEQLPEGWIMEESMEIGDVKRKEGYISVEELETYLEEYLVKNLPRFFDAYQKQDFREMNRKKEEPVTEQAGSRGEVVRRQNIMRSDKVDNTYVLGSRIRRREVISISFSDKLPEDASVFERYWDVSEAGDGSVMAYAAKRGEYYEINICGVGGVMAPNNCSCLFASYVNLQSVCFNGVFDTSQVTDMAFMFSWCEKLIELDVRGFDTSQVTDMVAMFSWCKRLIELDVKGFDTSQVTNMASMFLGCEKLIELDVKGFDTSEVTNMASMFSECKKLIELDVKGFDTSQVTDMAAMFSYCEKLIELDVKGFDTSQVTNMVSMFLGCEKLIELDVRGFDISRVKDMRWMFFGCDNVKVFKSW